MTKHELAALACKLLAIWVVWQTLISVLASANPLWAMLTAEEAPVIWSGVGMASAMLVSGLIGAGLWFGADRLANRMVREPKGAALPTQLDAQAMFSVALAVFGAVLLIYGFIDLVRWVVLGVYVGRTMEGADVGRWMSAVEAIAATLMIVLGLCLLLGSRGIANAVVRLRDGMAKLRSVGTHASDKDDGDRGAASVEADR